MKVLIVITFIVVIAVAIYLLIRTGRSLKHDEEINKPDGWQDERKRNKAELEETKDEIKNNSTDDNIARANRILDKRRGNDGNG